MTNENPILDSALELAAKGIEVFPIRPESKLPFGGVDWRNIASTNADKIKTMFTVGPCNLAVRTGKESGIIVLDVDKAKPDCQYEAMIEKYGPLPPTLTAKTQSGGLHYYFKRPPLDHCGNRVNMMKGIDIRGDNGYVVAPPSIGEKGNYEWVNALPIADCPSWLLDLMNAPPQATQATPLPTVATMATIAATDHAECLYKRARAYLATVNPAIQGKGGDTHTMQTAGHLASLDCDGQKLSAPQIAEVMADWNSTCVPPWSPAELAKKIDSAMHHGTPRQPKPCTTCGKTPNPTLPDTNTENENRWSIQMADWNSPENNAPVEWLWKDWLPLESISLVAGLGGLGKSTLMLRLAAEISKGGKFPDDSPAPLGDTIIFSGEDATKILKKRLAAQNANLERIHVFESATINGVVDRGFQLNKLAQLEAALQQFSATKLVIVDPVTSYLGDSDSNNTGDVRSLCGPIQHLAERYHIAVVFVAHLNKNNKANADFRIAGSLAWRDLARSVIYVVKDEANPHQRKMICNKSNYSEGNIIGQGFTFFINRLEPFNGRVEFKGATACNLDENLSADPAVDFVKREIESGIIDPLLIGEHARSKGISDWQVKKAKRALGVKSKRQGFGGKVNWALPDLQSFMNN